MEEEEEEGETASLNHYTNYFSPLGKFYIILSKMDYSVDKILLQYWDLMYYSTGD